MCTLVFEIPAGLLNLKDFKIWEYILEETIGRRYAFMTMQTQMCYFLPEGVPS